MQGMLQGLRDDIGGLRGEVGDLRGEVGDLRGEVGDLRGEVGELKVNLEQRLDRVEAGMTQSHSIVRPTLRGDPK